MIDFYGESFAPWCEKARWALDHHHLPYRFFEHVPMLGELRLRRVARRLRGPVTVPLLVHGDRILMDSLAIARYAEQLGSGVPLFPAGAEQDVVLWDKRSERLLKAGRALLLMRMAHDVAALREQLPAALPNLVRAMATPVAALAVRYLMRKYDTHVADEASHERACREVLNELREARGDGRAYLVGGTLSYADITMAVALQPVLPVADDYIPLGPPTRRVWTHRVLHVEYTDLIAWRDELYLRHR